MSDHTFIVIVITKGRILTWVQRPEFLLILVRWKWQRQNQATLNKLQKEFTGLGNWQISRVSLGWLRRGRGRSSLLHHGPGGQWQRETEWHETLDCALHWRASWSNSRLERLKWVSGWRKRSPRALQRTCRSCRGSCLLRAAVQSSSKAGSFMKAPAGRDLGRHPVLARTLLAFAAVSALPLGFLPPLPGLASLAAFVGVTLLAGLAVSAGGSHCSVSCVAWALCPSPLRGQSYVPQGSLRPHQLLVFSSATATTQLQRWLPAGREVCNAEGLCREWPAEWNQRFDPRTSGTLLDHLCSSQLWLRRDWVVKPFLEVSSSFFTYLLGPTIDSFGDLVALGQFHQLTQPH